MFQKENPEKKCSLPLTQFILATDNTAITSRPKTTILVILTWQIRPLQRSVCIYISCSHRQIHARSHPGPHVLLQVLNETSEKEKCCNSHCFDNCVQEQTHWIYVMRCTGEIYLQEASGDMGNERRLRWSVTFSRVIFGDTIDARSYLQISRNLKKRVLQ